MHETVRPESLVGKKAVGYLHGREWRTVYAGPDVRCFTIRFSSLTGPSGKGKDPTIAIYVGGDQARHWAATLIAGQSTDVCGKLILVNALLQDAQSAFWEAAEAGVVDWFE